LIEESTSPLFRVNRGENVRLIEAGKKEGKAFFGALPFCVKNNPTHAGCSGQLLASIRILDAVALVLEGAAISARESFPSVAFALIFGGWRVRGVESHRRFESSPTTCVQTKRNDWTV